MGEIQPFVFEGQSVRVVLDEQGKPWFVAADVCRILEVGNPTQALTRLDDDEKSSVSATLISNEGGPDRSIINESGLYSLVLTSRKPSAKRFKKWVTAEVLPSIRATGSYGAHPIDVRDPSQLAQVAVQLIEYTRELEEKTKTLEGAIEQAKPKVAFYDQYASAEGLYGLQNAARVLNQPPNKFIQRLKRHYLFYQGSNLVPYRRFVEMGLFEVRTTTVDEKAYARTYVTPKGIQYFAGRLAKEQPNQEEHAACS